MKPQKLVTKNSVSELTIEKLRNYKGFESISDEEALIHIENIKRFAKILFNMFLNDNNLQNPHG